MSREIIKNLRRINDSPYIRNNHFEINGRLLDQLEQTLSKDTEILDLLDELLYSITTINLDMGGDHRYALSHKSHSIIAKIKYKANS